MAAAPGGAWGAPALRPPAAAWRSPAAGTPMPAALNCPSTSASTSPKISCEVRRTVWGSAADAWAPESRRAASIRRTAATRS